jgi:ribosomal protein S12 methylthiotransferase accessory factor
VSALAEAIERYSGEFQGDEALVSASYRALAGEAIHPNTCMLFSESQYAVRDEINAGESALETIPEPLDETAEIEWCPVWPLDGGAVRYLPATYCFYDAGEEGARFASADSNGCAAGACREEAILQGFLELVERDAVAMWWYNRVRRPPVELASFQQSFFDEMVAYHRSINRDVWVLDLTTDLRIPVFAAVSRRTDKNAEDILIGFGAHLDARIGIQRALTEVNQSLPAVISVNANTPDAYAGQNRAAISWWQSATLRTEPYLTAADCSPMSRSSYSHTPTNDILEEVMECLRRASALGLRVFVLDQTRPDTGLEVVKVIVPGMRHFRPRFAPGRLYDVPVELGWLKEPTNEHELNGHCPYF